MNLFSGRGSRLAACGGDSPPDPAGRLGHVVSVPDPVHLTDGRTVPRALLTATDLPHYGGPTACWVCGIAVPADLADYALWDTQRDRGRARACPDCVAEQTLRDPMHRWVAVLGAITGLQLDPAHPAMRLVIDAARPVTVHAAAPVGWSAWHPGHPGRWVHLDADAVRTAVSAVLADADRPPAPHYSGMPCGVCSVRTARSWPGWQPAHRLGRMLPVCPSCHDRYTSAEHWAPDQPTVVDRMCADVAQVPPRPGLADAYGFRPYADAVEAAGWPHGHAEPWGWLVEDLADLRADAAARWADPALPVATPPRRRSSGLTIRR